jgi:Undecaprenyl-phosphate galactose phosphotransferase WbaP
MPAGEQVSLARPAAGGRWRNRVTRTLRDSYPAAVVWTSGPLLLADLSAVGLSVLASMALVDSWKASLGLGLSLAPVLGASLVAFLALAGLYPGIALNPADELRGIALAATLAFAPCLVAAHPPGGVPVLWPLFLPGWALTLIAVASGRVLARSLLVRCPWWGFRTIVAGETAAAEHVHRALRSDSARGLRPLALLDDSKADSRQAVMDPAIHYAVLAVPDASMADQTQKIVELRRRFRRVIVVNPETSGFRGGLALRASLFPPHGIDISDHLPSRGGRLFKRTFDLALAILVCPALLLLTIVVALLNKATSPGPVFFGHERIGKDGRRFKAWKFRTMVMNADVLLRQHLEQQPHLQEEWERTHKLQDDPRVTTIGRYLRRTSLDELPQIWNVLRGEMTLIGPRPIVQEEVARYADAYSLYTRVRPGLTGLWQVSGRTGTTYPQRVALDSFYVRKWSVWLDLYIFLRTFRAVLTGDGAR